MKKLIMAIFFILSLLALVTITFTIKELFMTLGFGTFDLEEILLLLEDNSLKDVAFVLGILLWGLFQLYGLPLIVFLVSLNGLTSQ